MPFKILIGNGEGDDVCLIDVLPRSLEPLILTDNPKVGNHGDTWDVISLFKVLRRFLANLGHGKGRPWKLKTLTWSHVDPMEWEMLNEKFHRGCRLLVRWLGLSSFKTKVGYSRKFIIQAFYIRS